MEEDVARAMRRRIRPELIWILNGDGSELAEEREEEDGLGGELLTVDGGGRGD